MKDNMVSFHQRWMKNLSKYTVSQFSCRNSKCVMHRKVDWLFDVIFFPMMIGILNKYLYNCIIQYVKSFLLLLLFLAYQCTMLATVLLLIFWFCMHRSCSMPQAVVDYPIKQKLSLADWCCMTAAVSLFSASQPLPLWLICCCIGFLFREFLSACVMPCFYCAMKWPQGHVPIDCTGWLFYVVFVINMVYIYCCTFYGNATQPGRLHSLIVFSPFVSWIVDFE